MSYGKSIDFLFNQMRNGTGSLAGGTAEFYYAGTTSFKNIYLDRNLTQIAANPYTLSADGTAELFGDGLYRIVFKDSSDVTIYDYDDVAVVDNSDILETALLNERDLFYQMTLGDVQFKKCYRDILDAPDTFTLGGSPLPQYSSLDYSYYGLTGSTVTTPELIESGTYERAFLYVQADDTALLTYEYSTDNGATWAAFTDYINTSFSSLKIRMTWGGPGKMYSYGLFYDYYGALTVVPTGIYSSLGYSSIEDALVDIGTASAVLRIESGIQVGDSTQIIPSNVEVEVIKTGMINLNNDLTINGPFSCGLFQCFSGAGSVAGLKEAFPQWWGATGDGVTDDTSSIQYAYTAANKVIFPQTQDYYLVSKQGTRDGYDYVIDVPSNRITVGCGILSKIQTSDDTIRIFLVDGVDNVSFDNIHIKGGYVGSGTSNIGTGILIQEATNIKVTNCAFEYISSGVYAQASDTIKSTYIYVNNNSFDHCGFGAVVLTGSQSGSSSETIKYFSVDNNTVTNQSYLTAVQIQYGVTQGTANGNIVDGSNEHGLLLDCVTDVVAVGGEYKNCTNAGICVAQTGSAYYNKNISVTGNAISRCGSASTSDFGGILITAKNQQWQSVVISSNSTYDNYGHGIVLSPTVDSTAYLTGIKLLGNSSMYNAKNGIEFKFTNSNGVTNCTFENNTFAYNSESGINTYGCTYNVFSNNKCFGNTQYGAFFNVSPYNKINGGEFYDNDASDSSTYDGLAFHSLCSECIVYKAMCFNTSASGQVYGIMIVNNSNQDITIKDCYLVGNKTGTYSDAGTNTHLFTNQIAKGTVV